VCRFALNIARVVGAHQEAAAARSAPLTEDSGLVDASLPLEVDVDEESNVDVKLVQQTYANLRQMSFDFKAFKTIGTRDRLDRMAVLVSSNSCLTRMKRLRYSHMMQSTSSADYRLPKGLQLCITRYLAVAACTNGGWYAQDIDEYFADSKLVRKVKEAKYVWALLVSCGGVKGLYLTALAAAIRRGVADSASDLNTHCKTQWDLHVRDEVHYLLQLPDRYAPGCELTYAAS
jgi:hypothetical protein